MTKKDLMHKFLDSIADMIALFEERDVVIVERNSLQRVAEDYDPDDVLPDELQIQMQANVDRMKALVSKMKTLRIRSDELKAKMDTSMLSIFEKYKNMPLSTDVFRMLYDDWKIHMDNLNDEKSIERDPQVVIESQPKWQNVMVTCSHGHCCEPGSITQHRLICPVCENVVWKVIQYRDGENPMFVSTKAACADCDFVFQSGEKCLICEKGTSFYQMSDYTFPDDDFVQFHKEGKNKSLIPRAEYIKRVKAGREAVALPLQLINGYLFVELNNVLWLLDTGAPTSFGSCRSLTVQNEKFDIAEGFRGFTADTISQDVGVSCAGLLGADILNCFDVVFNIEMGVLVVSVTELTISGQNTPMEEFMGVPIITAQIGDREYRMFFDTGAQISYFQDDSITLFPSAGSFEDFHFTAGCYQTETYNVPMMLGDMPFVLRCGDTLPEPIVATLATASVAGIIGNDVLKNRIVGYFPRRSSFVV